MLNVCLNLFLYNRIITYVYIMNRKTNLFYLSGNDSNFLTFSNYTEYLTSVFLNTSLKMFMSKFIALNLPFDEDHSIEDFKMFLVCYYENKLTTLRDSFSSNTNTSLITIKPLGYLLEAIKIFFSDIEYNDVITYIGNITEHDYNGTYADTICIIDYNNYNKASVSVDESLKNRENAITINQNDDNKNHLYGWHNELDNLDAEYIPHFDFDDEDTGYFYNSEIKEIEIINNDNENEMTFNCIIPLFDVYNIDHKTYTIKESKNNEIEASFQLSKNDPLAPYKNIPYGIWISPYNIDLHRDPSTHFGQSWSLVISSKFAPFPYGNMQKAKALPDAEDRIEKYTYAQLLADQTKLYASFQDALNKIQILQDKVDNLSKALDSIATYTNIDDIRQTIANLPNTIDSRINDQTKELREIITNLKWKNIG